MVDFVKINIKPKDVPMNIKYNSNLNFTEPINADTGEIKKYSNKREANYQGLKFELFNNGRLIITGSLHNYYNSGKHNANDLRWENLQEVIEDIQDRFNLNLAKCKLQNIEIGLNVTPPIKSKQIVDNILIYRTEKFKEISVRNGSYKQALYTRHNLKVYDKVKDYYKKKRSNDLFKDDLVELLRFEIKYRKMLQMNNIGIYTLNDLRCPKKIKIALEMLCERWDGIIMYDPTIRLLETSKHFRNTKRHKIMNPIWWLSIKKNHRDNEKKVIRKLFAKYADNIQNLVSNVLREKVNFLFDNCVPMTQVKKSDNCVLSNTLYRGESTNLIATHFNLNKLTEKRTRIAS